MSIGVTTPAPITAPGRPLPLKLATVGSVDDGKSTLIGRLLHDTRSIPDDQVADLAAVSRRRGSDQLDLALLTDGLRAERELGITIDVAHRYFSTAARDFVIADCPGHEQYTPNAITGASTADVAVVLVDARHGVVEQTRRHGALVALLAVPDVVLCVNKMDLVAHDQVRFHAIVSDFRALMAPLRAGDVTGIPISARHGDNVVETSTLMDWYGGPTLLEHLERVHTVADVQRVGLRFPVQLVIRTATAEHPGRRRAAGTVAAGALRIGDEVVVLPSGGRSSVLHIGTADGAVDEATAGMAVTVVLADELDVTRGDMLCAPDDHPIPTRQLDATVVWMDPTSPLVVGSSHLLKHTTRTVGATVIELERRSDIGRPRGSASDLTTNEIGRVTVRTTAPLVADEYRQDRTTGAFVLIDQMTNRTIAAGMIGANAP